MTTSCNKDTVRRIYEALDKGDRSVFAQSVSANYAWDFPSQASWSRRYEGQEEVHSKLLGPLFSLFADTYTAKALEIIGEGDTVVARVEGRVRLKTGEDYNNQYCFIFRFEDGMITEVIEYCDTDLEERALGPYKAALKQFESSTA